MRHVTTWLALVVVAFSFAGSSLLTKPADAADPVSYIELGDYRLYMAKDSNSYAVYSAVTKRWTSHTFPKHLSVKPWADGSRAGIPMGFTPAGAILSTGPLVGFELSDAAIEELVAIDGKGRFCTHKLATPIKRPVKPFLVGGGLLYCIVEGNIYAFSGVTGTWDVLEAPEIPEPKWKDGVGTQPAIETGFEVDTDRIVVKLPFGKMTFATAEGRWKLERKPAAEKEVSLPIKKPE